MVVKTETRDEIMKSRVHQRWRPENLQDLLLSYKPTRFMKNRLRGVDNRGMNIQAVRPLITEISARINPLSPSSLIDQTEAAGSKAATLQSSLLATAHQWVREGNRRLDHPSATPAELELPEWIADADTLLADVSLAGDWRKLAGKVRALHEMLAAE